MAPDTPDAVTTTATTSERLLTAVRDGDLATVRDMIENEGVDINLRGTGRTTPLMTAALYSRENIVRYLISQDAALDLRDSNGFTALIHAAGSPSRFSIAQALVGAGALIDEKTEYGNTALTMAARNDALETMELLLEKGASVKTRNKGEETALLIAADKGYPAVAALLMRHGADPEEKNGMGRTAFEVAEVRKRPEVIGAINAVLKEISDRARRAVEAAEEARHNVIVSRQEELRRAAPRFRIGKKGPRP